LALANSFIEKVDMFSSVQSGSRSAPCTTPSQQPSDKELLSDKDLRFAERIKKTANGNSEFTDPRKAKEVPPTLLDLAAAFCGANIPLNRPEDVVATRKFVDSIGIAPVQHAICRSLHPPDPKLLLQGGVSLDKVAEAYRIPPLMYAMKELVTIAIDEGMEDLRNGKSCIEIAEKRGIPQDRLTMYGLHLRAVKGPLAELVRNGEPCDKVAEKYGIPQDSMATNVLQQITIDEGPAGKCVGNGEPCDKVAEKYGLPQDINGFAMNTLQKRAIENGPAARLVERLNDAGKPVSCRDIAEKYGFPLDGIGRGMLEVRAARGVAGERVRKGESPFTVSDEHGIRRDSKAMEMLKMISVETRWRPGIPRHTGAAHVV